MGGSCCAGEGLRPSSNAAAVRCCCCSSSISTPAPSKTATTRIASRATAASQILRSSALVAPAAAAPEPSMSGADASRRARAVSSTGAGAPASAERSSKLLLGDEDIQALSLSFSMMRASSLEFIFSTQAPKKKRGRAQCPRSLSVASQASVRLLSRIRMWGKRRAVAACKGREEKKKQKIG